MIQEHEATLLMSGLMIFLSGLLIGKAFSERSAEKERRYLEEFRKMEEIRREMERMRVESKSEESL